MRFLLFGGTGQVGKEFRALAMPDGVQLVAPGRDALDLEDADAIARVIAAEPWNVVINAAAYTQVDRAEGEEPMAFAVNARAPSRLAAETGRPEGRLISSRSPYGSCPIGRSPAFISTTIRCSTLRRNCAPLRAASWRSPTSIGVTWSWEKCMS
jgi:hypothetical protein